MEIKITSKQILKVLEVVSWVIFIGLCVDAGGLIVNTIITLFINSKGVNNFWEGAGYLSDLYRFDVGYFSVITFLMILVAVFKAIMFYLIVKLFIDKKISISNPFRLELKTFILKHSYLALGIGLFAHAGCKYTEWLNKTGLVAADLQALNFSGSDVWLFMAVVLYVIAQVVNRGIEIQRENDLTI